MDKYEYRAKTEEMLALVRDGEFEKAEAIADSIDWRRVRSVSMLSTVSAIYEKRKHYYDAREILYIAYDRAKNSKKTLYKLTELAIKSGDLEDANDCYHEYASIADRDPNKFVLEYKLAEAKSEPLSRQIDILEKLKDQEYTEKWAYKLATLYSDAGMDDKCVEECDEISLWFTDGKFVKKALELKSRYTSLTPSQKEVLDKNTKDEEEVPEIQRAAGMLLESEVRTRAIEDSREAGGIFGRGKGLLGDSVAALRRSTDEEASDDELNDKEDENQDDLYNDNIGIGTNFEVAGLENAVIPGVSIAENLDMEVEGLKQDDDMKELDILQGNFNINDQDDEIEMITDEPTEEFNIYSADTEDLSVPKEIVDDIEEPEAVSVKNMAGSDSFSDTAGEEASDTFDTEGEDAETYNDMTDEDVEAYSDTSDVAAETSRNMSDEEADASAEMEDRYNEDFEDKVLGDGSDDQDSDEDLEDSDDDLQEMEEYLEDEENVKSKKHRFGLGAFFMRKKDPFYEEDEDLEAEEDEDDEELVEELADDYITDEYIAENVEYQNRKISEADVPQTTSEEPDVVQVESPEYDNKAYEEIKEVAKNLQDSESPEDGAFLSDASMEKLERKLETESVKAAADDITELGSLDLHGEIMAGLAQLDEAVELNEEEASEQLETEMTEIKPNETESLNPDTTQILAAQAQEIAADTEEARLEAAAEEAVSEEELDDAVLQDDADHKTAGDDIPENLAEALEKIDSEDSLIKSVNTAQEETVKTTKSADRAEGDGRFIMTERYSLESQAHIGKDAGLTDVEREIFSYFVPVKGISEQLAVTIAAIKNANKAQTSSCGNVIVAGDSGSGKTKLAVGIVKAIQREYKKKKGKVAVVDAVSLNGKNISDIFAKLYGGAIVIEQAGKLEKRTVKALSKAMREDTGELLVIIEDSPANINKVLNVDKSFAEAFDSRVVIPKFVNDDLVTFAQTYAKENGYRIQEMAILALYNRIDMLQREDHYVTVAEVARLMDEAFAKSKKNSLKRTMTSLFKNNSEDKGLTLLMEEDFE